MRTIIFDLDGTLLDTLQDLYLAVNYSLRQYGMAERKLEEVRAFVGNGVRKLMERSITGGEDNPMFNEVFTTFRRYYLLHCEDNTKLYPGVMEMLAELKNKGYRMAVVSNKLQAGVSRLHETYFSDVIDVAIGERTGIRHKPFPDMIHLALQELGTDIKDAVYVGDSEVDVATARNAGIPCISVLWGFREKETLLDNGAVTLITKPQELISKL